MPASGVVWKDTMGNRVPVVHWIGIVGTSQDFLILDGQDVVWRFWLDAPTPVISEAAVVNTGFTTIDCTGTPYAVPVPVRRVSFRMRQSNGQGGADAYAVPDNISSTFTALQSWFGPQQGCSTAQAAMAVPAASLKKVTPPASPPGAPPYHPE